MHQLLVISSESPQRYSGSTVRSYPLHPTRLTMGGGSGRKVALNILRILYLLKLRYQECIRHWYCNWVGMFVRKLIALRAVAAREVQHGTNPE